MSESSESLLPPAKLPAHAMPVDLYDLTLVWPLLIEDHNSRRHEISAAQRLESWTQEIVVCSQHTWQEVRRDYPNQNDAQMEAEYSEFVFFHPFVRNFLYASRDDLDAHDDPHTAAPNRNMRLLERTDLQRASLEVTLDLWNRQQRQTQEVQVCLQLRDVQLYLFDTRVALLVLKLKRDGASEHSGEQLLGGQFTLETVLQLQDKVRRAYSPYWERVRPDEHQPIRHAAGRCPRRLRLLIPGQDPWESHFGTYQEPAPDSSPDRQAVQVHLEHVIRHREPPAVLLWRKLLAPISPVRCDRHDSGPADTCQLRFEQMEDERLALFSYLAVPEPRRITTGDWLRLATVDDPGDSDRYPFSPEFLDERCLQQFCYDRFWSPSAAAPAQDWFTTRWLCCGYGFSGVGWSGGRDADDDRLDKFFTNRHSGARAHFRHHYFKLGLIAHFYRASLLAFKHDLAEAVEKLRENRDLREAHRRFQDRITQIEKEVLTFRTMYWCTEVSNQIQPQELFTLWSRHLHTPELFDQVFAEAREASQVIVGLNSRNHAEQQASLTRQQTWLTLVAALFLLIQPLMNSVRWFAAMPIALGGLWLILLYSRCLGSVAEWLGTESNRGRRCWMSLAACLLIGASGLIGYVARDVADQGHSGNSASEKPTSDAKTGTKPTASTRSEPQWESVPAATKSGQTSSAGVPDREASLPAQAANIATPPATAKAQTIEPTAEK